MNKYIQVFATTEKKRDAERIARILLKRRLAGCVQVIGPVSSSYWWRGRIEKAEEWLCVIKSKKSLYKELEKTIKENHPYEVPEIISIPIAVASRDYLNWLSNTLKK